MLEIPDVVRNKALGADASWWIEQLPDLLAEIQESWSLRVGNSYQDSTEAYVCEATLEDDTACVLKLMIPRDGDAARNEINVLEILNGEGCATLLRSDVARGALLLERLGPSLHSLGLPITRRHEILCDCVEQVWRRAPDCGLPTGAEKARWLDTFITSTWEALDHPCSEQAVDYAQWCVRQRIGAHDDERSVLAHGDCPNGTPSRPRMVSS